MLAIICRREVGWEEGRLVGKKGGWLGRREVGREGGRLVGKKGGW